MAHVFLGFEFIAKTCLQTSYNSHIRYILKSIFRNLKNGDLKFTNFQVLCCMELLSIDPKSIELSPTTTFDTPFTTMQSISDENIPNDKYSPMLDLFEVENITLTINVQEDYLNGIEKENPEIICEYFDKENKAKARDTKLISKIEQPEEFLLERISDPKVCSKVIILCVSGFTSEDYIKIKEWRAVCRAFPHSEAIALNWTPKMMDDDTFESTLRIIKKFIKQEKSDKHDFSSIWTKILSSKDIFSYHALKVFKDFYDATLKEAVITGVHLAHSLINVSFFQGRVISFIGSSFGTLVIMNCMLELERMGRNDIIYDVLLMGGVSHINDFMNPGLNFVCQKIINCYCKIDYSLKYSIQMANPSVRPIGVSPITSSETIISNFDA